MKERSWWKRLGAAVGFSALLAPTLAVPASASSYVYTVNGGAGFSSSAKSTIIAQSKLGGSVRGGTWLSASSPNPGEAWNHFVKTANQEPENSSWFKGLFNKVAPKMGMSGSGLINACKTSQTIWWIQGTQNGGNSIWVWNYKSDTGKELKGTIASPFASINRTPNTDEVNAVYNWYGTSSDPKLINKDITIVCLNAAISSPPAQLESQRQTVEFKNQDMTDVRNYSGAYSYYAQVNPQFIQGTSNGAPGDGPGFESQSTVEVKTNYGKLVDKFKSTDMSVYTPEQIQSLVDQAKAKDAATNFAPQVNLSQKNKDQLAKGGVLNVTEFTKNANMTATRSGSLGYQRTCHYKTPWDPVKQAPGTEVLVGCDPWVQNSNTVNMAASSNLGAAQQTGFYQILSVHCNRDQFAALVAATGATEIQTGDSTKKISAVAQSKKYNARPAKLDFGDSSNPDTRKSISGNVSFYDKECPFDCTASASGADANTTNGAKANKGASGVNADGTRQGVVSADGVNANRMEFFRDNEAKNISFDVWYPADSAVVDYNGAAPITTTVSRWGEGTPSIDGSDGGKFTMKTKNGTQLFTGANATANQKNWDTATSTNSTSTILSGFHRDFTVQGSWASAENKPQVLNVKWEYAPSVGTKVPTTLGFSRTGATSNPVAANIATVKAPIQGKCYANFGTNKSADTTAQFAANTGTGTQNKLDGFLVDGVGAPPQSVGTNYVVNFVRAVAE